LDYQCCGDVVGALEGIVEKVVDPAGFVEPRGELVVVFWSVGFEPLTQFEIN